MGKAASTVKPLGPKNRGATAAAGPGKPVGMGPRPHRYNKDAEDVVTVNTSVDDPIAPNNNNNDSLPAPPVQNNKTDGRTTSKQRKTEAEPKNDEPDPAANPVSDPQTVDNKNLNKRNSKKDKKDLKKIDLKAPKAAEQQ